MNDRAYFNTVAALAVLAVLVAGGVGLVASGSPAAAPTPAAAHPYYLNLSIAINATNGWPQYSPANFTVPKGEIVVTIVDHDMPMSWSGCGCVVAGTVGNREYVNGSATGQVPSGNVAHTFTVPALHINVLSPAQSTVTFTLWLNQTGQFPWMCLDPCGSNGYTGAPMGVPGYMTGTMTVF